jgi:hypothetical protein
MIRFGSSCLHVQQERWLDDVADLLRSELLDTEKKISQDKRVRIVYQLYRKADNSLLL